MPPPPAHLPDCPAGLTTCPILPELRHLKEAYRLLQAECQRLQKLSQTDPLTRLFNRGYLMISLEQEMERTRRTSFPTSLIMLDLDYFKRLNDTYGHQFGDAVLCRVAVLLKDNIRKLDIPCRYGGEEFVVILPGTRLPQAVRLAVRLQETLAQSPLEARPGNPRLTASFGVETFTGREDLTSEAFLQRADRWLFMAKAQGRNMVCHRDSPRIDPEVGLTPEERRAFFTDETHHNGKAGGSYG